jgi:hypothetical protein
VSKKGRVRTDNEQSVAFLREREKDAAVQADEDLRAIMATPAGRRFMYRLAYDICGVENGIWSPSAEIHFQEGRRSVGIQVKNDAQRVAPREYVEMIQERINAAAHQTETRAAITEE